MIVLTRSAWTYFKESNLSVQNSSELSTVILNDISNPIQYVESMLNALR